MRIALITETFAPEINGVAMTFGNLVNLMVADGHQVQVIRPRQSPQDRPKASGAWTEVLCSGIPFPGYPHLRLGFVWPRKLRKLWESAPPDIVHVVTEGPLGLAAVSVARKLKLPLTSSFHTHFHTYLSHYRIGWLETILGAYWRRLHNRTMATMAPTQEMLDVLASQGYLNLSILSRGLNTTQFSPQHRSPALRQQWGVGDDGLVLLCVGRLAKEKSWHTALAAFAAMQKLQPQAKLVMVGDGPQRQSLQQACPQVVFTGELRGQALAECYASADVFVFPSTTETYGNVVPEALASGLCVLAFDYAAAALLIRHQTNGVLVPKGDEQGFIKAAAQLAVAPQTILTLRHQASASVAHLSWQVVYSGFMEKLAAVIQTNQRHKP